MSDRAVCGYALLLCVVLMVMVVSLFAAFRDGKESQQTSGGVPEESEAAVKPKEEGSSDGPISFPKGIRDSVAAQEPQGDAKVVSCKILPDGEQFALKGETGELPESDDDNFYLVALKPYEESVPEGREAIAETKKEHFFTLTAPINEFQENSRLYDKFVVTVKADGQYVAITAPHYITNPEALAGYSEPFPESESIKGLLVDPLKLATSELDELGVKHAVYNIPVARILGPSTHSDYPTITYTYNGKKYTLNGHVVDEYDYVFRTLTRKGIVITAILLNNKASHAPQIIHPLSR